jgi:hypothetical protein
MCSLRTSSNAFSAQAQDDNLQAQDFVELARNRLRDATEAVMKSVRLQKVYYDRQDGPIQPIQAGDYVSIRLDQHPVVLIKRMKLTQPKLPPYKVLDVLANNHAVKLDIPPHIGSHSVISIQHVERSVNPADNPFQRSNFEEPGAIDIQGDRWEGEIVDEKTSRTGQKSYLVHWIGWSEKFDEWLKPGRIDLGMIQDWEANCRKRNSQLAMTFLADTLFSKEPISVRITKNPCIVLKPKQRNAGNRKHKSPQNHDKSKGRTSASPASLLQNIFAQHPLCKTWSLRSGPLSATRPLVTQLLRPGLPSAAAEPQRWP